MHVLIIQWIARSVNLVPGVLALFLGLLPTPAYAEVTMTFYLYERGTVPHVFITLSGALDGSREPVAGAYGFGARNPSPAALISSVRGEVYDERAWIEKSVAQYSVVLTDGQVERVLAVVRSWREAPQPSYNLNRRNCIHFVAEIARAGGMAAAVPDRVKRTPRSFLALLQSLNPGRLRLLTVGPLRAGAAGSR